ncbi:MAG: polysaccharide biosynthesis/export family protein [Cyanobacteria bacterium P01_F01_bin.53]
MKLSKIQPGLLVLSVLSLTGVLSLDVVIPGIWNSQVLAQDIALPVLPPASSGEGETAPAQSPASVPASAAPASTPTETAPASSVVLAAAPFRSDVQPTQTQPPLPQPLPQPLAPALPFNTNDPLKPGDVVQIDVLGFPNLSGQQQVGSNGTVQLPLGGPVFIGGYSPLESVSVLREALLPYVKRPELSIALVSASPLRVSVSGEVMRPGPRLLSPLNSQEQSQGVPPTLSTALIESGGITPSADLRNIVIRRAVPTRTAGVASPYGEFRVNLWEAVSSGDLQADPRIFDGDEIIVPTAEVANIDQRTLLSSTVAPEQITVQVAGQVNSPGQLNVSPMVGVSGAIAAAGGPTVDAKSDEVVLLRMMPDGRVEQLSYAFGEASEPLVEGDVVFVEASNRGSVGGAFDFLGRVLNPFGTLLDLFNN